MSKREYALFVDGPSAGRVFAYPGSPEIITAEYAQEASIAIARFDPSDLITPLVTRKCYYRRLFRDPMPFGYVPYMLNDDGRFTAKHAEAATRMIELLVEHRHAESSKTLVEGYQRTTALLESRLSALERRLSAVMANHGLSELADEPTDEEA